MLLKLLSVRNVKRNIQVPKFEWTHQVETQRKCGKSSLFSFQYDNYLKKLSFSPFKSIHKKREASQTQTVQFSESEVINMEISLTGKY